MLICNPNALTLTCPTDAVKQDVNLAVEYQVIAIMIQPSFHGAAPWSSGSLSLFQPRLQVVKALAEHICAPTSAADGLQEIVFFITQISMKFLQLHRQSLKGWKKNNMSENGLCKDSCLEEAAGLESIIVKSNRPKSVQYKIVWRSYSWIIPAEQKEYQAIYMLLQQKSTGVSPSLKDLGQLPHTEPAAQLPLRWRAPRCSASPPCYSNTGWLPGATQTIFCPNWKRLPLPHYPG